MSGMAVAAKRYAKALFETAKDKGQIEETGEQLQAVAQALAGNPEIQAFFDHPKIGNDVKIRAVKDAVSGKVSEQVVNTLQLLIDRGRGSSVGLVAQAYKAIADEFLGRANAYVTSAFDLTPEQQEGIARHFSAVTGKKVTVETVVDKSLLGGIRIRIGDTLYDGSLATKLAELERSFNKAR
ncbi:F0F1 ATP synthase subunit delta [Paenibacillus thermotolerans]|uniref:F0F1 ATP synthase subunit delta n=1 Tax=Paenibacillus thermotolerans TaxID=3027807 RepID=UPI002368A97E|nr:MULTISPECIES: F0F1 ATP synthase subunit delta [unclassified Paenibacillus]